MKKRYSLRTVIVLVLLASALVCTCILFLFNRTIGFGTARYEQVRRYSQMLNKLDALYVGDYDEDLITDDALKATVESLGDRWSYYMTADEYESYINASNNQFVGLGVVLDEYDETQGLTIAIVYPNSPAEKAGIAPGDVLKGIDGESILGMERSDAIAMFKRTVGQQAEIAYSSGGIDMTVTVTYDYVFVEPVTGEMLDGNVGYISISNFDTGAYDGFKDVYNTLLEQGADRFIFDVRNNGGGYVSVLRKILDFLLPDCEVFISVDRDGNETVYKSDESYQDYPAVVMCNENSYSAAEYFAAVLDEYDYAVTVGAHTTGKGRSQITVDMMGGGALHISSNSYVTPQRVNLYDAGGIAPEYEIEMSEEDQQLLYSGKLEHDKDEQLKKAVELLAK